MLYRNQMEDVMDLILSGVSLLLGIGVVGKVVGWLVGMIKETQEALASITDALADSKIDNAEIQKILKEAKDVVTAAKTIKDVLKK